MTQSRRCRQWTRVASPPLREQSPSCPGRHHAPGQHRASPARRRFRIGHGGANDAPITRQAPDGRGGTKHCQTTRTAAANGYPEHSFNRAVVQQVRATLEQLGAHTELSRRDSSVGPCVDQRAAAANAMTGRDRQHPRRRRSAGRPGLSRQLLESAPQRGAERPCNAVGGRHAQLADGRWPAGLVLHLGRAGSTAARPCRSQNLAQYPGGSGGSSYNMRNGDDAKVDGKRGRSGHVRHGDSCQGIVGYLNGRSSAG